jgi:cbb3-type cytochrome oxidase subunit 3
MRAHVEASINSILALKDGQRRLWELDPLFSSLHQHQNVLSHTHGHGAYGTLPFFSIKFYVGVFSVYKGANKHMPFPMVDTICVCHYELTYFQALRTHDSRAIRRGG